MINYNKVKIRLSKKKYSNLSIDRLKVQFSRFTFINLQNIVDYKYLLDSLDVLCQWNSFQIKKINESKGIDKILLTNNEKPESKYYGRIIAEKDIITFQTLIKKYNFKYIFFINKFETITRRPFSTTTYFCLHFEIYDTTMNKIYGGKSYWNTKISKTMFYNVFYYFVRNTVDDFYKQIKKFIMLP